MIHPITLTAGIDTGKEKLDVAVHGHAGGFTVTNDPAGWKTLTAEAEPRRGPRSASRRPAATSAAGPGTCRPPA